MRNSKVSIRTRLIRRDLAALLGPFCLLSWFVASQLWHFYVQQLQAELTTKANLLAAATGEILSPETPDDPEQIARIVGLWHRYSTVSVVICDTTPRIQGSTTADLVGTVPKDDRVPGLMDALRTGRANSTIWKSPNFGYEDTLYVNVPAFHRGRLVGVIRVAYTLGQVHETVAGISRVLIASLVLYVILLLVLNTTEAVAIVRPLERLVRDVNVLAAGNLEHEVHEEGSPETVRLAKTINTMRKRLFQLETARRQFVSDVSHELRTPLAAIRAMTDTLVRHGPEDPDLQERYLGRIVTQTERLARLATQLQDLAQAETGNLLAEFKPVSLLAVVDQAAVLVQEASRDHAVTLTQHVAAVLPEIAGDADRLVQVVVNVLDNAVRHTEPGGKVELAVEVLADEVVISVADRGPGIAPEHVKRIFDRFYRVDRARSKKRGGSGLGLAITRQIVELHKGSIEVESTVGQGTTIRIRLPKEGQLR